MIFIYINQVSVVADQQKNNARCSFISNESKIIIQATNTYIANAQYIFVHNYMYVNISYA